MVEPKKTKTAANQTVEERLQAVEERLQAVEDRLQALEGKKCDLWENTKAAAKELNIPTDQTALKEFVRENPLLSLGIAIFGTILLLSLFS